MVITQSKLMRGGPSSNLENASDVLPILRSIGAVPVHRNKGIDGFVHLQDVPYPVPVRVQRKGESLEEALRCLLNARRAGEFEVRFLVRTNPVRDNDLFANSRLPGGVILVDSLRFQLEASRRTLSEFIPGK